MLEGALLHLLVVYVARILADVVVDSLVEEPRAIDGRAVGEVSAVSEVEAHKGVPRVEACQEHSHIGLRPRVRLHVGPLGAEELLDAVDGELLGLVDHLAATVVALAGVAFGVLVRHAAAHGLHDLIADEVL